MESRTIISFPAYLRGIETAGPGAGRPGRRKFPAYLRGIETGAGKAAGVRNPSFQPTYEGLKLSKNPRWLS